MPLPYRGPVIQKKVERGIVHVSYMRPNNLGYALGVQERTGELFLLCEYPSGTEPQRYFVSSKDPKYLAMDDIVQPDWEVSDES